MGAFVKRIRHIISTLVTALVLNIVATGVGSASTLFLPRDHLVIDLTFGVEWLRCSVGQK